MRGGRNTKRRGAGTMLRNMATVFLFNEDKLLMLKRSADKAFNPGVWSVIVGHIESHEWKNPLATALRELSEETGFSESDLIDINFRYILIREARDEIRMQYVFVAKTDRRDFRDSNEGELYWVPKEDILSKNMTVTIYNSLKHYLEHGNGDGVTVGVFDKDGRVVWSKI